MAKRIEMNIKESDSSYEVLWPEDGRYTDEEILSDEVKTFWGLEPNAIPSDAFMAIAGVFDKTVNFTVTIDGAPAEGVTIEGFNGTAGSGALVTNSEGKCTGITTDNTINVTAKSPWIDAKDVQYNQTLSGIVSNVNIAMTSQSSGRLELTESKTLKFSPSRTKIEYCIIGGGASGGCDLITSNSFDYNQMVGDAFGGSGGGRLKTGSFNNSNQNISISVGSGGNGVSLAYEVGKQNFWDNNQKGYDGGSTSLNYSTGSDSVQGGYAGEMSHYSGKYSSFDPRYANGGSGGSGGGGAYVTTTLQTPYAVGNGGINGQNGITVQHSIYDAVKGNGGSGQGTTTIYDGKTYCRGTGGAIMDFRFGFSASTPPSIQAKDSASYSMSGSGITSGNNGAVYGDAGGVLLTINENARQNFTATSGAGKQGVVILKWTS